MEETGCMSRRWVYGKQDWKTFERGQENCYLMTNGLGGFSSMTMIGSAARNDHAFLMACVKAPNNRYNMVHRLAETVEINGRDYAISSQEYADGYREEGWRWLSEFSFKDIPVWNFHVNGVEIRKEAALKQGENTAVLCYRITNRTRKNVRFTVTPFYQFAPKGSEPKEEQHFSLKICEDEKKSVPDKREEKLAGEKGSAVCRVTSNGLSLFVMTDGRITGMPETAQKYYYAYDACDGRRERGMAKACHQIELSVKSGCEETLSIIYTMEEGKEDVRTAGQERSATWDSVSGSDIQRMVQDIVEGQEDYREGLEHLSGIQDENARTLVKSADQFLSLRESTGGKTILAGYPFFEDWGRDTMIALPGVCISTRRYEEAESILRTFARYERNGLLPNLFPEGKSEPMYNTADASLLFINCVWLYYKASGKASFVKEMYSVMERIIHAYKEGTDYGVHMDDDGLISAGSGLDQVTWMDVRVGEILPTPRHGKPVEINAYWYNALRIMGEFARLSGVKASDGGKGYDALAEKVKESFTEQFWMEDKHCLKDVISGTEADTQIRCNQIWAVSMPFAMLDEKRERQVVDTVFEKLYTPYGLRTLSSDDREFQPFYGGEMIQRDLAYHQGTVWTYPLGAYYLAYLKVNGCSPKAKQRVKGQLEVMESAMREGCIGQLPEIYDGENPVSSKGCFAQAWSVGEILRVYEALERD